MLAPIRGVFKVEAGVADDIVARCDRKPFRIQKLCRALVNRLHETGGAPSLALTWRRSPSEDLHVRHRTVGARGEFYGWGVISEGFWVGRLGRRFAPGGEDLSASTGGTRDATARTTGMVLHLQGVDDGADLGRALSDAWLDAGVADAPQGVEGLSRWLDARGALPFWLFLDETDEVLSSEGLADAVRELVSVGAGPGGAGFVAASGRSGCRTFPGSANWVLLWLG